VETLAQLRDKRADFAKLGVKLACVVQGNADDAEELCGPYGMADVCVPDPRKESYRKFGLDRTTWMALVRPSEELRARRKENREAGFSINVKRSMKSTCDILLLPGAALAARGGKILWVHRGANPGDMPNADALLETARLYL
jgi:alkyl-hydroperoxide reductase/thiol specific antioxidant family protein